MKNNKKSKYEDTVKEIKNQHTSICLIFIFFK